MVLKLDRTSVFFFAVGFEIKWFSGMLPVDDSYLLYTDYVYR